MRSDARTVVVKRTIGPWEGAPAPCGAGRYWIDEAGRKRRRAASVVRLSDGQWIWSAEDVDGITIGKGDCDDREVGQRLADEALAILWEKIVRRDEALPRPRNRHAHRLCHTHPETPSMSNDWMTLGELREGAIFETRDGIRAVKSEYRTDGKCDCYLLASGEAAHFSARTWPRSTTEPRCASSPVTAGPRSIR